MENPFTDLNWVEKASGLPETSYWPLVVEATDERYTFLPALIRAYEVRTNIYN